MKRILLTLTIVLFFIKFSFAQNEPTISTCDGNQDICLVGPTYDLCVEIEVDPLFTFTIDSFLIDFDDGSPLVFVTGSSNPPNVQHLYDHSSFYNMDVCSEEFTVRLYTYYTLNGNVVEVSTATFPEFFNPPNASFGVDQKACVGDEVDFNNTSFPTCSLNSTWNYGDGTTGSDPFHTYSMTGNYTVTLTVDNPCAMASTSQQIEIISPAQANIAIVDSQISIDTSSSPYIICSDNYPPNITIPLDGDSLSTMNPTYFEWQSLSGINASYTTNPPSNDATPNASDVIVTFSDTGIFQIILEVDNECNQPSFDTLFFQILTGAGLGTLDQDDACLELIYDPDPLNLNPTATYTINGVLQTSFPVTLGVDDYEVICTLTNECGTQTRTDNFVVFTEEDVSIISPSDTTLCMGSDSIQIFYTPLGGTWTGDHLTFYGDSVFFNPVDTGMFTITYSKGIGDCKDSESITITVEGSDIITIDHEVCSISPPFFMGATPPGGIYTSSDCPLCIQGDIFIISEMVALGLTTVTVNYSNSTASGCDGNNTFTVMIDDPIAMFVIDSIFCLGDPVPVDISNTHGTLTWMVDGQNSLPPPFINLSGGNHVIKLTAMAGDCEDVFSQNIFITSPPSDVSFTASQTEGCADLEVTLMNTTSFFDNESYEWFLDDSLFSIDKDPGTIILTPGLTDTIYTISLSAGNSCEGQIATQEITVFPRPVPQFGPMQNYYCSGDTVSFSNISFGGPMSSWFWDYGNGMTSTDSIPLEIIYFTDTIPSTYTVSLTATNDCGTETFTYEIVINPTDVFAFFNVNPISGCVGEEICLTNLSTLGANVLWDLGDGNTNTQNDICHTYSSAGTYTITLKAFGCGFDSITFDVTILPIPDAIFSNNSIVCPGDPLSFSNTSDNAVSFLWDFGDGNTSTLNNPTHTFVASGNYTVKLFATSNEGCVDSTFSSVTVLIPPVANFTVSTDSVCVGDFISFNSTSTPNPLTCLWSFGDGETSNDCNPTHSYDSVGNYIVTLIVTDNNDCGDTTQQLINVAIVPTPMFSFSQDGECSPVKIVFDNQTTNGESYEWSFGDGNTSTDEPPTHTYLSGGDFPIQLIAINGVCSASTSQNILINQTPDAEIIAPLTQAGCVEFEAPFSSLPSGVNYTYKWDFGDGTFSFEAAPTHTFSSSGTFQVMLIAEDEPCVDTAFTEMIAFEPVETSVSTIDNPCYGDTIGKIDITVTNGTSDFQYQWAGGGVDSTNCDLSAGIYTITITDDNGCTWTEGIEIFQPENPISIDVVDEKIVTCYGGNDGSISIAADGGTPSYTYLWETGNITTDINNVPTGNYPITITDLNGCTLEESVVINQNDSISYKVIVDNISCFGAGDGQISFDSLSGGIPEYFITVPQLDSAQGTAFNGLLEGPYSVILTDAVGCVQTFTTTISEPPEVWIEVEQDTFEIILGETVAIESNHNVANPIFVWTPSRGLNCSGCEDPFARPFVTTTYEVLMTDENGCFALDTVFVDVEDIREIAIPNIFTPNNDGENDVFTLLGNNPAVTQVTEFRVFDRYGGILFKANDFELNDTTFGWDGKFRGIDAQVGTYIYTAKIEYIDGRIIDWSGSLMLIR